MTVREFATYLWDIAGCTGTVKCIDSSSLTFIILSCSCQQPPACATRHPVLLPVILTEQNSWYKSSEIMSPGQSSFILGQQPQVACGYAVELKPHCLGFVSSYVGKVAAQHKLKVPVLLVAAHPCHSCCSIICFLLKASVLQKNHETVILVPHTMRTSLHSATDQLHCASSSHKAKGKVVLCRAAAKL